MLRLTTNRRFLEVHVLRDILSDNCLVHLSLSSLRLELIVFLNLLLITVSNEVLCFIFLRFVTDLFVKLYRLA